MRTWVVSVCFSVAFVVDDVWVRPLTVRVVKHPMGVSLTAVGAWLLGGGGEGGTIPPYRERRGCAGGCVMRVHASRPANAPIVGSDLVRVCVERREGEREEGCDVVGGRGGEGECRLRFVVLFP